MKKKKLNQWKEFYSMPKQVHNFEDINKAIKTLWLEEDKKKSTYLAIDLANKVLEMLGVPNEALKDPDLVLDEALSSSKFSNQKMETWFASHFRYSGARLALNHFDHPDYLLKSRFYQLNEAATKARISASTQIDDNWEDSELTRKPEYKVGIDFFLNANADSLLMVVTNFGNLRVMELSENFTHTQRDIFSSLVGMIQKYDGIDPKTGERIEFEPQKSIHKTLWDTLALESVNKGFYDHIADLFNELQIYISNNPPKQDLFNLKELSRIFSIRLIGRILFVWFLRKKDFISLEEEYFEIGELESNSYYDLKLKKLFFETLNLAIEDRSSKDKITPYLNGGLFSAHEDDLTEYKIDFPKKWFNRLYDHLHKYNFTVDESSPEYEQVAIDPEILGRVFENLLASIVPETSKTANERKNKGTFYTPRPIVDFMCKESLKEYLFSKVEAPIDFPGVVNLIDLNDSKFLEQRSTGVIDLWKNRSTEVRVKVIDALNELKVFDPACGSGAFPIGILNLLVKTYERLSAVYDSNLDKMRPAKPSEKFNGFNAKYFALNKILYGSDIEPMAIEITRLRAWLSLIIDVDNIRSAEPLPNLDFNYVCANSLIPLKKNAQLSIFEDSTQDSAMQEFREKYFNARTLKEKESLRLLFNEVYFSKSSEDDNEQIKQLKTWDPFNFRAAEFFDAKKMFNQESFNIIIGNPPYIGEKGNKKIFDVIKRNEFGKKYYLGKMDYFYFFFHLGINLLSEKGILSFITTNYYPTADAGKLLRKELYNNTTILKLVNFNEVTIFESAKGQHDLITILQKGVYSKDTQQINIKEKNISFKNLPHILKGNSEFTNLYSVSRSDLFTNKTSGEYYIRFYSGSSKLEEILRYIQFSSDRLLGDIFNVNQGLITGADKISNKIKQKFPNINGVLGDGIFVHEKGFLNSIGINDDFIKPFYKNSDISRWVTSNDYSSEILYLDEKKSPSSEIINFLSKFKDLLSQRSEFVNGRRKWYELHRSRNEDIFTGPKIVAPHRNKLNVFAYNEIDWFSVADVYYITQKNHKIDMFYVLAILNSKLIYVWLYHRGKRKGEMLELVRTPLMQIPMKIISSDLQKEISLEVQKLVFNKELSIEERHIIEEKLNLLIFDIYGINEEYRKTIEDFINLKKLSF